MVLREETVFLVNFFASFWTATWDVLKLMVVHCGEAGHASLIVLSSTFQKEL